MRTLIVSASFPTSCREATYSFVYNEAFELLKKGAEVRVARFGFGKDAELNGIIVHNAVRLSSEELPFALASVFLLPHSFFFHPAQAIGLIAYAKGIVGIVRRYNLEILHAHFAWSSGFAALLARNEVNLPLVVTLHGADILTETSIGYGVRLCPQVNDAVEQVLKNADRVIVASNYVYNEALKTGCPRSKLICIPNGVDVYRFRPNLDRSIIRRQLDIRNGDPMILTVRAHVPKNGIEFLLRAAPMVIGKHPNAKFVVVGDGPLLEYHKALAERLGVAHRVFFSGYVPECMLPYYYAAADVSVVPSVVEAFGLVVIEAMACAKPVIGSRVGGIPDMITDGTNGLLVNPKDPEALTEKICYLIENPKVAGEIGINARKSAEEEFSISSKADRILKLYQDLL